MRYLNLFYFSRVKREFSKIRPTNNLFLEQLHTNLEIFIVITSLVVLNYNFF